MPLIAHDSSTLETAARNHPFFRHSAMETPWTCGLGGSRIEPLNGVLKPKTIVTPTSLVSTVEL